MIPHGRTADCSIPYTLGAPLGPNIDILMPEPSDDFDAAFADDEFAATTAPARAATTVLEEREPLGRTGDDPDVPHRTRIVPTSRRRTPPPATTLRDTGMTLDYPLSEPSLWPDAFDPEYGRPFPRKHAATEAGAAGASVAPAPQPNWVQRHRIGLVVGFGIVPFMAVPMVALLGTQSARLIADLQVPQMSYFIDWVIVGSIAAVASTALGMRYVLRRRRSADSARAVTYETIGQES